MNSDYGEELKKKITRYFDFTFADGKTVTGIILNRADSISNPKEYLGNFLSNGLDHYDIYKANEKYFAVKQMCVRCNNNNLMSSLEQNEVHYD